MKRAKLISVDSPLYMKRVVREVRRRLLARQSVWAASTSGVLFKVASVRIYKFGIQAFAAHTGAVWADCSSTSFRDESREITASRTERNDSL